MALLLIGGSTILTSCVSEDVSPEVENLRQAQVNFLNSQTELEQAQAENQRALTAKMAAETALIQVQVELQQLQVQLQQALLKAETAAAIAELEAAVAEARASVERAQAQAAEARAAGARAEVALQEALDKLAGQVNETAQEYLDSYQSTMAEADLKLTQINGLKDDLLRFNAFLNSNGELQDFEGAADAIEALITELEAEKVAKEESIARLEQLNPDAAAIEEELEAVESELETLNSNLAVAILDNNASVETYFRINDALFEAENFIGIISNIEENIENNEVTLEELEETINSLESQISPFQAELDATEGEFLPALEEAEALLETWIQARTAFIAADINNDAGDQEYDEAKVILDAAITAFEAYAGTGYPNNPQVIRDFDLLVTFADPASDFGEIITQFTNVLNNPTFADLQNRLSNAITNQDSLTQQLNNNNILLDYYQNLLQTIYSDYGVNDISELETLFDEAFIEYLENDRMLFELSTKQSELLGIANNLRAYLNGYPSVIEDRIDTLKSEITALDDAIQDEQAALANNEISAEEWTATIARTEAKIASLTIEYEALIEFANFYLEQFNEVVGD